MADGIVRPARRPPGWIAPGPAPLRPDLAPGPDEDLCYLTGDWRIFQLQRGHRWSLDDLVTAWIATRAIDPHTTGTAIDLGCGLGSVLLAVAWKLPHVTLTGIEAQPDRAALGRRSITYNLGDVAPRATILDGDLRDATGSYDLVTGTPPYFPRGTGTESAHPHALACRFELRGGVEDYLATAARLVAPGGSITICSAALERDRVTAAAPAIPWAEHWDIVPREGKAPLVCVDRYTTTHAGPRVDHALVVRDRAGQWTPAFRRVRDDLGMP